MGCTPSKHTTPNQVIGYSPQPIPHYYPRRPGANGFAITDVEQQQGGGAVIRQLAVSRRRCNAIVAIDKSYSMTGTSLAAAKAGAKTIVNTLQDGDAAAIFTFNDKVEQISEFTEIGFLTKSFLSQAVDRICATGGTALYDCIVTCSLLILTAMSAALESCGHVDLGSFCFVLLTDGEDMHSQVTFDEAKQYLALLNESLGSALKIVLIGVKLDGSARRRMQELAQAGGEATVYHDARNREQVEQVFHQVSVTISQLSIQTA